MRRRLLLAASAASGGGKWAYELHLTPEWESGWWGDSVSIDGDFNELCDLLSQMLFELGEQDDFYDRALFDIPEEFNVTVDGVRLSEVFIRNDVFEVYFTNTYCSGILTPTNISLERI